MLKKIIQSILSFLLSIWWLVISVLLFFSRLFDEDFATQKKDRMPKFEEWVKERGYESFPESRQRDLYDYHCDLLRAANRNSGEVFVTPS